MILADKIINLRKKSGMSQEELADKLGVSRQSVSKWEQAQSVPDINKIIAISEIFNISTDYLLKDELEIDNKEICEEVDKSLTKLTLEDASNYINKRYSNAPRTALGVSLCILSPVVLILLSGISEFNLGLNESVAAAIGVFILIILIALAVGLFIYCGFKTKDYEYIQTKKFESEYGVVGLAKDKKKALNQSYYTSIIVGSILCILSCLPLIILSFFGNELYCIYGVCILLVMVSIGAGLIINVCCKMGALDAVLQEGDYTEKKKKENPIYEAVCSFYWFLTVAIYLIWSFVSSDWHITWIVWPIAGVLYAGIFGIVDAVLKIED